MTNMIDNMKLDRKKRIFKAADIFLSEHTIKWIANQICQTKFVLFVRDLSLGEKNGSKIGKKCYIAQNYVGQKKITL